MAKFNFTANFARLRRAVLRLFSQSLGDVVSEILLVEPTCIVRIGIAVQLRGLGKGEAVGFHELADLLELDAVDEMHDGHTLGFFENGAQIFGRKAEMRGNVGLTDGLPQVREDVFLGALDMAVVAVDRGVALGTGVAVDAVEELEHQPCTGNLPFRVHGVRKDDFVYEGENRMVFGKRRDDEGKAKNPEGKHPGCAGRCLLPVEREVTAHGLMLVPRFGVDVQRVGIWIADDRALSRGYRASICEGEVKRTLGNVGDLQQSEGIGGAVEYVMVAFRTVAVRKEHARQTHDSNVIFHIHAFIIAEHLNFVKII